MSDFQSPGPDAGYRYAPVIILGMHRSGTSLVTRLLQQAGLFTGCRIDQNSESIFFLELNDWILKRCGASWEYPHPIDQLEQDPDHRELIVTQLRRTLVAPLAGRYLGRVDWYKYRRQQWLPFPWGWKDPRNTFTLPLWLELFPDARVINVERHGIDVALSLKERVSLAEKKARRTLRWMPGLLLANKHQLVRLSGGLRRAQLHQGVQLWADYMRRAKEHCNKLGERAITIRFEGLLGDPERIIGEVLQFAGLSGSRTWEQASPPH